MCFWTELKNWPQLPRSTLSWNTDLKRKSTLEEIFSQGKTTLLPQTGTMGLTPCPRPPKCYREAEHGWTLGQSMTSTAASQTQESQKGAERHWKQEGHLEARGDGQVTGWLPSGRATWRPGFPNATAPDPEPSRGLLWFRFRSIIALNYLWSNAWKELAHIFYLFLYLFTVGGQFMNKNGRTFSIKL